MHRKHSSFIIIFVLFIFNSFAAEPPTGLTTDLLEHTDRVFLDGYPANFSIEERHSSIERYQFSCYP